MLSQEFKFTKFLLLFDVFLNHSKWYKTEPSGDGTAAYYNISGVYDTNKAQNYQVICVQNVACK